ncbi:zinc finger and BTB domain-containing protein 4 [Sceloporus undulatus]|uniref:zinc finger and BTB domain-containing protein 4 n=1 Tax=Sceloporus undulatus TaxID=8520 RepID=UPI001C4D0358|nr:zinc finger and BTB domain-containing protein 4 [Sceloporus undulatus]XP_042327170.1 zinc finger and BTB domain-containing protein 4 [Sceloporus undulatus]XP_042327171.1 zinc finger and BTB domain-containing protein 4 [Sceloporus undulatus]XP_042327172.1 zinc finger and BTB domain-containing protein 4 [Sceloporus undulatus]XP_042327173.1 zinc finger and BTB domain-containing protein 4 [Sceloporus undulatus]XP_042327174.1 zinc finger and BTB domain-containing protein 4 [Sceloporus undulatus]
MAPVVEVTDISHSSSLLVQLNEQRLRGQFCDITIIAEDTKFKAHKNILAASSPYFKEVLSEDSVCRQPGQILELPDIQAEVFSDILNFIYNSRLSVPSPAAAKEIGAVGRRLGISRLENLDDSSADAKMDDSSVISSRLCGSPIDLTCPSRSAEPSSPLCFQELAKASSPAEDAHPDSERETAKILYNLSSVTSVPLPPPPDLAFVLKGSAGWDQDALPGNPSASITNNDEAQAPVSACSSPSGASYPASSTFCCGTCSRSFTTSSALSLHMKLHRTRRSLSCRHCGKGFIHIKRLQTHEVLCKEVEKPKENTLEGSEMPPDLVLPSKPVGAPASAKKGVMFRHRGLTRMDYISDQDHFVKVVDGHIIYFCTVCERSYMTLSSLKRHSNVHSWRRKYPCRYCDKVFALAEYRTKHEVWHTGERRYQCIFCWETFVTYYNLKTHQKAFHGINPGLISSEKTPNGGYKPKLNALKLYRLLPMRSQKRPYKTYSQGLVPDNLLLPTQPIPMTLGDSDSLDGNLVSSLGTSDVPSVFTTNGSSLELPEEEHFQQQDPTSDREMPVLPPVDEKAQPDNRPGAPTEAPTVIAYGRPASSVIVHSTSVKSQTSSVITYNSKSSDALLDTGPPLLLPQSSPATVVAKPIKKQVLKDYIQSQKADERASEENGTEHGHRVRGVRAGRTMTYMAKPAYVGTTSESRAAPLCQITVRIGEEAIVKRRISETDLMLDKSGRVGSRRFDFGRDRNDEKQQPHPTLTLHSKHGNRSYTNESGEEDSDRGDTEDQLWRPYYSYKPKRKACGGSGGTSGNAMPKMKKSRWRRKLRSLRWMKRTEKAKEAGEEEEEEEETKDDASVGTSEPLSTEVPGGISEGEGTDQPSKAGSIRGSEWKHECSVCGKLFSALKKLRKHERVHGRLGKEDHSLAPMPGTPHRVGRKPLVKFTCAHCTKVCKTAAALSRHMKRHEGKQPEPAPLPTPTTVIAYSKKTPDVPPVTPSPVVKEETTQEMQVSSSSGEAPLCRQEVPEDDLPPMDLTPYDVRTLAPMLPEESSPPPDGDKSPFPEELPIHPPTLEAATSLVEVPPSLPHSLQDPVISHTGLVQKEVLVPPPEMEEEQYPVQEYPLPLLVPGSCRTRKDLEDKASFLAYPSAIQFNAVGKAGSSDGDSKVSFYPDPYPLMYGHQLLAAYPYNFTLPVALNMVVPDDKGQPLPFLPSVFSYSMNPCRSEVHEGGAGSNGGMTMGGSMLRESRGEPTASERLKKGSLL